MKIPITWRVLTPLLFLILLAGCASVPETGQQIVVLADGDALRKDAAEYAKLYDVPLEEALRRLKLQRDIGKLDARIARGEPDTFAGLWIQHKPDYGVVVNMAGNLDAVARYTAGTPVANITETHRVEKSLKQLEREQAEATTALRDLDVPLESEINVRKNQVEVYVLDETKVESLAGARSAVGAVLDSVNVTEVNGFSQDMANAYAGNKMNACTAGYSVFDGNGRYGITTAGHCSDSQFYDGVDPAVYLEIAGEWWRGAFDVQWHYPKYPNSGLLFKPWARDNQPTSQGTRYYREMYAVVNRPEQAIGTFVCKHGYNTGYTCGEISSKTFNPYTSTVYISKENNSPTFVHVNKVGPYIVTKGGDSGGPVYDGHAALGLVKGGWGRTPCSHSFCGDMIYMAINYVTDQGLRLHLAPR